jgi:hypothetical protein
MADHREPVDDEEVLDLDALAPELRPMRFRGVRYHVLAAVDLPIQQYAEIIRLDRRLEELARAGDEEQILEVTKAKLRLLVTDMPEEALEQLRYRQALAALAKAWALARPRPADPGASSTASPGSAATGTSPMTS